MLRNNVFSLKKALVYLLTTIMLLVCMSIVWLPDSTKAAQAQATSDQSVAGSTEKIYVIDEVGLFTDTEKQQLQEKCKKKSENCKIDLVIITTNVGLDYSDLDNYARKILEEQYGYNGTGSNCDASCYIIDMKTRADRIITSGRARTDKTVTDSKLKDVLSNAEGRLTKGDYYDGCVKYITGMERILNKNIMYKLTLYLPIKILISIVVAVVAVLIMMHNAKAKVTVSGVTYARNHAGKIVEQHDRFINTTVVKRVIENKSSNGGFKGSGGNSGSVGGHF